MFRWFTWVNVNTRLVGLTDETAWRALLYPIQARGGLISDVHTIGLGGWHVPVLVQSLVHASMGPFLARVMHFAFSERK